MDEVFRRRRDPAPVWRSPVAASRPARGTPPAAGSRDSSCWPDGPNRSLIVTCTPAPASTAWTWHLRLDRSPTSFARCRTQPRSSRVARRGDPRLGQPTHPQQICQIRGVALIIIDPPKTKTPSPPAGAPDAPSRPARPAHRPPSTTRKSPPAPPPATRRHATSPPASTSRSLTIRTVSRCSPGLAHPHQHRAATMQIHTPTNCRPSIDFAHKGPPLFDGNNVSTPSMRARNGHEERRPRSFMTSRGQVVVGTCDGLGRVCVSGSPPSRDA